MRLKILVLFLIAITVVYAEQAVKEGHYIVADMDGTLIGAPFKSYPQKGNDPILLDSPCYEPLVKWLSLGGRVMLISGNEAERTKKRFFDYLPRNLRKDGRVIMVGSGGAVFCFSDNVGDLVEDAEYKENFSLIIPDDVAEIIVTRMQKHINDYFLNLERETSFPAFWSYIIDNRSGDKFTLDELITNAPDVLPRIEVRRSFDQKDIVQIVLYGVPGNRPFNLTKDEFECEGLKLDIIQGGVTLIVNSEFANKKTPLLWMLKSTKYGFNPRYAYAIGDNPNRNDKPMLEFAKENNMSFISVCEKNEITPQGAIHLGKGIQAAADWIEKLSLQED